jgi:hypothetical protein
MVPELGFPRVKRSEVCKGFAKIAYDSILACDEFGFEKAFGSYLGIYEDGCLVEEEGYYKMMIHTCLLMANQDCRPLGATADGRVDLHFTGPKREEFLIGVEIHIDGKSAIPSDPREVARLRKAMAPKADKALNLLHAQAQGFLGSRRKVVGLAFVVARATFVLAKFKEMKSRY